MMTAAAMTGRSTAAKHGIGILDALTQGATGTAWIPAPA
jgi:hypothetical protein